MLRPPMAAFGVALSITSAFAAAQTPVTGATAAVQDFPDRVVISVRDQKLMVVQNNQRVAIYPVSTSELRSR